MALAMATVAGQAKTLVVYYSFTNHCRTVATDLRAQLPDADLAEVEPAEEGLDYAANGYAIGSALIAAIRNAPSDPASYPPIKDMTVNLSLYDDFVIVTPLWWSNMAAPMQTFLFHNGAAMAGKRVGLIVSSASSGIERVEADARRLVSQGQFTKSLWIRSAQTTNCHALTAAWLTQTGIGTTTDIATTPASTHPNVVVSGGRLMTTGDCQRIDIYDATGRQVLSAYGSDADLSPLHTPGVYVAIVRGGQHDITHKFGLR